MLGSTAFFFAHLRADHAIRLENHRADLDDRDARRHVLMTRLDANREGNYPIHFREATLEFIAPPPGNRPFADNIYFQPGAGVNRPDKITVMKPSTPNEIRVNAYNQREVLGEVSTDYMERLSPAPDFAEISAPNAERGFEPKQELKPLSVSEIQVLLTTAKREGENKTAAIFAQTGAKPGGSKAWNYWSNVWDEVV